MLMLGFLLGMMFACIMDDNFEHSAIFKILRWK